MKKIVKTIGLACLAGLFAVSVSSCKKNQDNTTKVVLDMEEIEDIYPNSERAYINMGDRGITYWNRHDQVRAYNLNVANDPNAYLNSTTGIYECGNNAEDQTHATFYGPSLGAMQSTDYRFFYPVGMVAGNLGPFNVDTFTVAKVQYHTEKIYGGRRYTTIDPLAMPLASSNTSLHSFKMKHVFGYLRLHMTGQGHVTSLVLRDRQHGLTGKAVARLPKFDVDQLTNLVTAYTGGNDAEVQSILTNYIFNPEELALQMFPDGDSITLQMDEPVELDSNMDQIFMFAVRPGTLYDGFDITVKFNDRADLVITSEDILQENPTTLRALTMRPGKCHNITYTESMH